MLNFSVELCTGFCDENQWIGQELTLYLKSLPSVLEGFPTLQSTQLESCNCQAGKNLKESGDNCEGSSGAGECQCQGMTQALWVSGPIYSFSFSSGLQVLSSLQTLCTYLCFQTNPQKNSIIYNWIKLQPYYFKCGDGKDQKLAGALSQDIVLPGSQGLNHCLLCY